MKYFNPSYWFKLLVLTAPLFNDKTQGINAKSIDNQNIKDWANNNTSLESINESSNLTNSITNYQPYNLTETNQNINPFYQTYLDSIKIQELETSTHKHRHEKSRNRYKREQSQQTYKIFNTYNSEYLYSPNYKHVWDNKRRYVFTWRPGESLAEGTWKLEKTNNNITDCQYKIFNTYNSEYLYSPNYKHVWDNKRRYVFTWRPGQSLAEGTWKLEKTNNNITDCQYKIFNTYNSEYLYSPNYKHVWDNKRRYVFTWRPGESLAEGVWEFQNNYSYHNIKNDFPDWNKVEINLGIISDNVENDIKNAIKHKYPSLKARDIEVIHKNDYSHFTDYSTKIHVSNPDEICFYGSYGKLKPTFRYITKKKLHEISNIIANDLKFKQWITHINDWNSTLPQAIANAKNFSSEALYNWKRQEKEIIKNYIRDWSYVSTLIEHELKLDELNKNVQGLKSSFDAIKMQVNELEQKVNYLDKRVQNLENVSNLNCVNIATIAAGAIALVPVIGTVGAAVSTIAAGACGLAGV